MKSNSGIVCALLREHIGVRFGGGFVALRLRAMGAFALLLVSLIFAFRVDVRAGSGSPEASVRFSHLSNEQGLTQNFVNAIAQDRTGLIWFGTQDGLDVFDGYEFRHFRHSDASPGSLTDNFVNSIFCDPSGALWVGTMGGLNRLDPSTGTFVRFTHDPKDPSSLAGDVVTSLTGNPDGSLWIGTIGGLQRIRAGASSFERVAISEKRGSGGIDSISVILRDRSGMTWVGTWNGVTLLDSAARFVDHYGAGQPQGNLSHNEVLCMLQSSDGSVFVGTRSGLNVFDRATNAFRPFLIPMEGKPPSGGGYIGSLTEDMRGAIWVGTETGLWKIERGGSPAVMFRHDPVVPGTISDDHIRCSMIDAGGTIWFGTSRGVDRFNGSLHKLRHFRHDPNRPASLKNDQVWAIGGDGGTSVYIGTSQGVDRFDRSTGTFDHAVESAASTMSIASDVALSISADSAGRVWFGSSNGILSCLSPGRAVVHYPLKDPSGAITPLPIFSITQIDRNRILLGTLKGISVFDIARGQFVADSILPTKELGDDNILVSLLDSHRNLWFGTMRGLVRWNIADKSVKRFVHDNTSPASTLSHDRVYALAESPTGEIWIGTHEGLDKYDAIHDTFRTFGIGEGLQSSLMYGVLCDGAGNIWVSSNRGISRLDPKTGQFTNFDRHDGAQDQEFNQFSFFKTADGELFFGGGNGFNAFRPDSLVMNTHVPPIVMTGLHAGGKSWAGQFTESALTLPWNNHSLSFALAALDYAEPSKNRYAYMLEGFDKDWIQAGAQRFVSYTNLDPGEYTLKLRGSNNDGVWNDSGVSIRVVVVAPFWQALWFKAIALLVFAGMILLLVKVRTQAVHRRNRILEERIAERTAELSRTVDSLEEQIKARQVAEQKTLEYQGELQNLAAELSLTEERERRRMASLLHDDIGQALAFCRNKLDMMEAQGGSTEETMEMLRADLEKIIAKTRSLTFDLSPPVLYELGLTEALEWLLEKFAKEHAVEFHLSNGEKALPIPDEWRYTLFLAVRELIVNALKHAAPSRIDVRVKRVETALLLTVADDGKGFDPSAKPHHAGEHGGFGLFNVRERLRQCNGRIEVVSRPGEGTTVTIMVPL